MRQRFLIVLKLTGAATALAFVALLFRPVVGGQAQEPPHRQESAQLTADQNGKLREKERAAVRAGVDRAVPADAAPTVHGPQPFELWQTTVHISRDSIFAGIEAESEAAEERWPKLKQRYGSAVADAARAGFLKNQEALQASVPVGGRTIVVEMAHVGEKSINFGSRSLKSNGSPADPVSVVFFGFGSAFDVEYDLRNWASEEWQDSDGRLCRDTSQLVRFDETDHGGVSELIATDLSMQPSSDACSFSKRAHFRLWQANTLDHDHGYKWWSVATPHWEEHPKVTCYWWSCSTDYLAHKILSSESGRDKLEASFRTGYRTNGSPLWFVGSIVKQTLWPNNDVSNPSWDGKVVFIELTH